MPTPARSPDPARRRRWLALAVLLCAVVIAAGAIAYARLRPSEYAIFTRPDGNYRVVVLRRTVWPAMLPGQSGDAPGMVQLQDRRGRVLHQVDVEMVQLVDQVEWPDRKVEIKLVAEWDLPD
jgi:hypothetical protein